MSLADAYIELDKEHMAVRAKYTETIGKLKAVLDVAIGRLDDRLIDNIRHGMTTGRDAQRVETLVAQMERVLAESDTIWGDE